MGWNVALQPNPNALDGGIIQATDYYIASPLPDGVILQVIWHISEIPRQD